MVKCVSHPTLPHNHLDAFVPFLIRISWLPKYSASGFYSTSVKQALSQTAMSFHSVILNSVSAPNVARVRDLRD